MKALLSEILSGEPNPARRRSIAREYLQARILQSLQDNGAFANWAFLGGTALRFLFALPRYSEDLDFSLWPRGGEHRFEQLARSLKTSLEAEAYAIDIKVRRTSAVASALVKFPGLLYELGLSPHQSESLGIKVEIDTNPPDGAGVETTIIRRHVLLNVLHYDRSSLFAGKIHAVLMRQYTKGRDLYDLAWYLASPTWPPPNLLQLNDALRQTGWTGAKATEDNWRGLIREKLRQVEWKRALADVDPFLEREEDAAFVSKKTFDKLLD